MLKAHHRLITSCIPQDHLCPEKSANKTEKEMKQSMNAQKENNIQNQLGKG